jgi:hypothetical protein
MRKENKVFLSIIDRFVSKNITLHLNRTIKSYEKLILKLYSLSDQFFQDLSGSEKYMDTFAAYLEYYDRMHDLIKTNQAEIDLVTDIPDFSLLEEEIKTLLEQYPEKIQEEQHSNRFTLLPDDLIWIRIFKIVKIGGYRLSLIPLTIGNFFRKLFKKEPKKPRYWSHNVPYHSLIKLHFEIELLGDLEKYRNSVLSTIGTVINESWVALRTFLPDESEFVRNGRPDIESSKGKLDQHFNTLKKQMKDLQDNLAIDLNHILQGRIDNLFTEYPLAGTIEYRNRSLKTSRLSKKNKKVLELWGASTKGWGNTYYAIFDDWKSDLEIYTLRNKILSKTLWVGEMLKSDEYLFRNEITAINNVFDSADAKFNKIDGNLRKNLVETKYLITKNLNYTAIPALTGKIGSRNLSGLISMLEKEVESNLEELSDSHVIVRSEDYLRPLKSNELENISISDLAAFELLPKLRDTFANVKNLLFAKLAESNESIMDLDNIAVFALETALSNTENPDSDESESLKIAVEGIERAKRKANQIDQNINTLYKDKYEDILNSILEFTANLKNYTDNENVIELRVRIVKSKAIEHSKSIRRELKEKILNSIKQIWIYTLRSFNFILVRISDLRKRFFLIAPQPVLTREVSDFLSYSNKKIDELPFLYKNLYKIQPISDRELFIGRNNELIKLRKAYENWMDGNYSTTVLIGEKWGGSTSLLSNFLTINSFKNKIHRIQVSERILDGQRFISWISGAIGVNEVKNLEELINLLNDLPSKKIIILEDIQKMYLRKINGFQSLRVLFELINNTHKNIFWVTSCTIYAWNYLKKSISIHDYFSHIILMEKLHENEIIDIIKKRNRISGLNVIFEPDNKKISRKKIRSLSEEEQQKYLQKIFFDDLGDFSESNISLALLFWLLCTKEISESKLIIGDFEKPDLSFLKVINMDRVLILLALILHDGLNEQELSEVNNITSEESKLIVLMLLEDGIIYQENNNYLVNPLIYRNVIRLLKSKNLIQE